MQEGLVLVGGDDLGMLVSKGDRRNFHSKEKENGFWRCGWQSAVILTNMMSDEIPLTVAEPNGDSIDIMVPWSTMFEV
jgi:hypothetical protein